MIQSFDLVWWRQNLVAMVGKVLGHTQIDATSNAYLRPDQFDTLPAEPLLLKHGCECYLVSHESVIIKVCPWLCSFDLTCMMLMIMMNYTQDIPGIDTIRELSSFRRIETLTQPRATRSSDS